MVNVDVILVEHMLHFRVHSILSFFMFVKKLGITDSDQLDAIILNCDSTNHAKRPASHRIPSCQIKSREL